MKTACVQEAVVRAVGHGLDISPVDVIELSLQHAVKAGQLIARQRTTLIRQDAQEHRESAVNGKEVRIRVRCARRQCPSHVVGPALHGAQAASISAHARGGRGTAVSLRYSALMVG